MPSGIKAHINPDVLRWARESIRMDAAEAAERIGTTPDRLADWEDGLELPTIQQMRKICEVYKRPLAVFYLPESPKDFRVPNDFRRLPDTQRGAFTSRFLIELRRMTYQREVAIQLAGEPNYPIQGLLGSVTSSAGTDDVARRLREVLDISEKKQEAWADEYASLNGWKDSIEKLGVLVFHFERVRVADARGVSVADYPFPFIGVNGTDTPQARTFTLLHEFCHLLLNASGVCDTVERLKPTEPRDEIETFCNRLAGSALVSSSSLSAHPIVRRHGHNEQWSYEELKALALYYKVSLEVVLRRLLVLRRTNRAFYKDQRDALMRLKPKGPGGPLPVPRRVLRRIGQPFARIVTDAYYDDRITGSDLAEFLGARLKWLPDIEALLESRNVLTGSDA